MESWLLLILRQGSGVGPDSGEAVLRSRLGRNYRQLPARGGRVRGPSPADIVCSKKYAFSCLHVSGRDSFFGPEGTNLRLLRFNYGR
jgi:hypothetical protein